jgi:hypothetical protein
MVSSCVEDLDFIKDARSSAMNWYRASGFFRQNTNALDIMIISRRIRENAALATKRTSPVTEGPILGIPKTLVKMKRQMALRKLSTKMAMLNEFTLLSMKGRMTLVAIRAATSMTMRATA